jgi:hypothetical protein
MPAPRPATSLRLELLLTLSLSHTRCEQAAHELAYFDEPIAEEEEEDPEVAEQVETGGRADGEGSSSQPSGSGQAGDEARASTPSGMMPSEFDEEEQQRRDDDDDDDDPRGGGAGGEGTSSARALFMGGGGGGGGAARPFSSRSAMVARSRVAAANPVLVRVTREGLEQAPMREDCPLIQRGSGHFLLVSSVRLGPLHRGIGALHK